MPGAAGETGEVQLDCKIKLKLSDHQSQTNKLNAFLFPTNHRLVTLHQNRDVMTLWRIYKRELKKKLSTSLFLRTYHHVSRRQRHNSSRLQRLCVSFHNHKYARRVLICLCISSVHDTKKWHDFKLIEFQPKAFEDYDVDIKIEYCGVCGSDVCSSCSVLRVVL
jgi:hypothetical protein